MPGLETLIRTNRFLLPEELALDVKLQTSWQGKVMGFTIKLKQPGHGISLEYMARLPSDEDSAWTPEGQLCGGTGVIEGFAIRLTGEKSAPYSMQYRAKLEVIGETAFVVDGAFIGTRRQGLAVMGMEVRARLRSALLADTGGDGQTGFRWENWNGNQHSVIAEHYHPTTLQQLLAILQRGIPDDKRVRAIGSSWCYSDAGIPDLYNSDHEQPQGYLVETHGMAGFLGGPFQQTLDRSFSLHWEQSGQELLVHVEAGITVHALHALLDKFGLAIPTAGGSGGQTICGAISTGTHGGDFMQPPIADMVRAIQLVAADGSVYWIEKTRFHGAVSDPATVHALAPHIDPSHIIYDDECFNSVLVSMGAMGIIYSLVIAVRPRFALHEICYPSTWFEVEKLLLDESLFHNAPWVAAIANGTSAAMPGQNGLGAARFVEVAMTPNSVIGDRDPRDRSCMVTARCETSHTPCVCKGEAQGDLLSTLQQIDDFRPVLGAFAGILRAGVPTAGGLLATLGAIAPFFEPFLPGASAIIGSAVIGGSAALALAYPHLDKLSQILAACSLLPDPMNLQKAMVFVFQAAQEAGIPGALPAVNRLLLPIGRKAGSVSGPSYALMGNSLNAEGKDANAAHNHFVTDSLEIFFDATDRAKLVENINVLLNEIQQAGDFGGYVSLRFTGPTTANLGMQQGWTRWGCAIEVTFFKGFPQNLPMLQNLQQTALTRGGRLHWGQLNGELTIADVHRSYPKIKQWKMVRGKLTHNFSVKTFHNVFSGRLGLDGPALQPAATIVVVKGIVSTHNLITNQTTGEGTFRINTVDMSALAKVTWNGSVPGSTVDGTVTLQFTNLQGSTPQTVTVEATDIFGDTVTASAQVPVTPGPSIGGPPIRFNRPIR